MISQHEINGFYAYLLDRLELVTFTFRLNTGCTLSGCLFKNQQRILKPKPKSKKFGILFDVNAEEEDSDSYVIDLDIMFLLQCHTSLDKCICLSRTSYHLQQQDHQKEFQLVTNPF